MTSTTTERVRQLATQLPGWHVWYSSSGAYFAVPAPAGTKLADAIAMPGRIGAHEPAGLLALCQARYGWDDTCDTCGVLARECGHRGPEQS